MRKNLTRTLLFVAAPGSGKSTIAQKVESGFKFKHVSSGNLLQAEVASGSQLGRDVGDAMKHGNLVNDENTMQVFASYLSKTSLKSFNGLLLDGLPRTMEQVHLLDNYIEPELVINLDVPFGTIIERLSSRLTHLPSGRVYNPGFNPPKVPGYDDETGEKLILRNDDQPEVVTRRLENYEKLTKPILDFYTSKSLLKVFSGTETKVIWPKLNDYLREHFKQNELKFT